MRSGASATRARSTRTGIRSTCSLSASRRSGRRSRA
jgi:hypothetical protein